MQIRSNRPIPPKNPKVRNSQALKSYRQEHPYCELCRIEGEYVTTGIELHHIFPGPSRTDQRWNIICLCQRHHQECTEHIHGEEAQKRNCVCLAVKWLKGEISEKKLTQFEKLEPVLKIAERLEGRWKQIKKGEI